jgi:hypothetical protein
MPSKPVYHCRIIDDVTESMGRGAQHQPKRPRAGAAVNIRLLSWNLRDIAGFERSHIAVAIASKAPIAADKLVAIGRIVQIADVAIPEGNFKANEHPTIVKGASSRRRYFSFSGSPSRCAKCGGRSG